MELAATRIKRLLELISSYSFNLYYMKGKDMILSDFLLWQNNDESNPNEIIPISFDMYKILENNLENFSDDKYLIQMQSQAKSSGIKLPEVHGVEKSLNHNLRPEKQHTFPKKEIWRGCIQVKEELDQRGRNLIQSIKLSTDHQTCHRKFLEERK